MAGLWRIRPSRRAVARQALSGVSALRTVLSESGTRRSVVVRRGPLGLLTQPRDKGRDMARRDIGEAQALGEVHEREPVEVDPLTTRTDLYKR